MSRFAPFTRIDIPYRVFHGIPLQVTILTPRSICDPPRAHDKKHPVIVRWHGGGFVVGHRMYEPWFAQWLLDLAEDQGAIVVSPDYRLLPESTGSDILSDVAHFWQWLQGDFPRHMERRNLPRPDISNVLCCGESSGGFISVYCALHLHPMLHDDRHEPGTGKEDAESQQQQRVQIRAVISISAPLDATAPEYQVPRPRVFMGRRPPPPREALATIRGYIRRVRPGAIRTGCEPTPDMWELLLCIAQQAYLPRLFGTTTTGGAGGEEGMSATLEGLMETLDRGDRTMVPVWVVHGADDTMCPSACSSGFAKHLQETQPEVPVHLTLCPGEHLFDVNTGRDARWVQEGTVFLQKHWPNRTTSR